MKPTSNQTLALEPVKEQPPMPASGLSIEQVFAAVQEKQISPENIEVMRQLLAMDAEQKFAAAFVELQAQIPTITAKTQIPNRGKYEKFEDLMAVLTPLLAKHKFTVSFSQTFSDNPIRIIETCHLSHGRHTLTRSFAVRTRKADSDTQADCMAATTAKRNALCNALNIVIRQDCLNSEDDAGIEGDVDTKITEEQAEELEHRVLMTNSNTADFLKYAKAISFADIMASRYTELNELLARKERAGR